MPVARDDALKRSGSQKWVHQIRLDGRGAFQFGLDPSDDVNLAARACLEPLTLRPECRLPYEPIYRKSVFSQNVQGAGTIAGLGQGWMPAHRARRADRGRCARCHGQRGERHPGGLSAGNTADLREIEVGGALGRRPHDVVAQAAAGDLAQLLDHPIGGQSGALGALLRPMTQHPPDQPDPHVARP